LFIGASDRRNNLTQDATFARFHNSHHIHSFTLLRQLYTQSAAVFSLKILLALFLTNHIMNHVATGLRTIPHCMVLPPGDFNDMIPQPLTVYSESFMTTAVTVFA